MKPISIGPDLVSRDGVRIVVDAARDMPDWEVRKARRAAIKFRDVTYFVAAREPGVRGRITYVLEPWPERSADVPGVRLVYDRRYVEERDRRVGLDRAGRALTPLVVLLTPLVGFLPSAVKRRIHVLLGIHPITATRWSVYLQLLLVLLLGSFLVIMAFVAAIAGPAAMDTSSLAPHAVQALLLVDLVFRIAGLVRGTLDQDGVYEWLLRPIVKLFQRR